MISNQILQNTIDGLKGITPVSYTHLDVYKRQHLLLRIEFQKKT